MSRKSGSQQGQFFWSIVLASAVKGIKAGLAGPCDVRISRVVMLSLIVWGGRIPTADGLQASAVFMKNNNWDQLLVAFEPRKHH